MSTVREIRRAAEKYRAVIDGEIQDEPVGQRWGKVESVFVDEGVLIHPPPR